jgi:hypothetical protein
MAAVILSQGLRLLAAIQIVSAREHVLIEGARGIDGEADFLSLALRAVILARVRQHPVLGGGEQLSQAIVGVGLCGKKLLVVAPIYRYHRPIFTH